MMAMADRFKIFIGCMLTVVIVQIILSYEMLPNREVRDEEHQGNDRFALPGNIRLVSDGHYAEKSVINKLAKSGKDEGKSRLTTNLVKKLPGGKVVLSQELQEELDKRLKAATDKKIILVWMPSYGEKLEVDIDKAQCGNCEGSYDRSKINDENVGAVLFHFYGIKTWRLDMPPKRNPNHLYIFWTMESTAYLKNVEHRSLKFEDSYKFNSTMTYRRDSDIYESDEWAGTVESIVQNNNLSLQELLKMKTKLAVAIVSNCGKTYWSKVRMRMLKELNDLKFGLDAYGSCFGRRFEPYRTKPSFNQAVRKYKFYFSFESQRHCKDYISEKFFNNALLSLSVPVVWGSRKEEYEAVAPPGSFIFAEDFPSMKALSEYLIYLDGNDTAYLEYLKWITMKPSEMPQYGRARRWCHICRALHGINIDDVYSPKFDENNMKRPLFTNGVAKRTVENLIDWYYGEENPECLKTEGFFSWLFNPV